MYVWLVVEARPAFCQISRQEGFRLNFYIFLTKMATDPNGKGRTHLFKNKGKDADVSFVIVCFHATIMNTKILDNKFSSSPMTKTSGVSFLTLWDLLSHVV